MVSLWLCGWFFEHEGQSFYLSRIHHLFIRLKSDTVWKYGLNWSHHNFSVATFLLWRCNPHKWVEVNSWQNYLILAIDLLSSSVPHLVKCTFDWLLRLSKLFPAHDDFHCNMCGSYNTLPSQWLLSSYNMGLDIWAIIEERRLNIDLFGLTQILLSQSCTLVALRLLDFDGMSFPPRKKKTPLHCFFFLGWDPAIVFKVDQILVGSFFHYAYSVYSTGVPVV